MPDLSSRLNATRWPPASSTATVIGTRFISRAFLSATSTMVLAWARVTDMAPPWGDWDSDGEARRERKGTWTARYIRRHDRRLRPPYMATYHSSAVRVDQYTDMPAPSAAPRPCWLASSKRANVSATS